MDDDVESLNIFNFGSLDEFNHSTRPQRAPVSLEGAGTVCELKDFDSVYDAEGKRVEVRSGSCVQFRDRDWGSFESALVRTRFWSYDGEEEKCNLEIRSSYMKAALKSIIPSYRPRNFDTKHITLPNAGRDLFHYQSELFGYGQTLEKDSEDQLHVSFLIQYFNNVFWKESMLYMSSVDMAVGPPSLDFAHLWMVFKPGEVVYVPVSSPQDQSSYAFEFDSMDLSCACHEWTCVRNHFWRLKGYMVDTDLEDIGYSSIEWVRLPYYDGEMNLADLRAVPLRLRLDEEEIRSELVSRGRKFVALQGRHHRQYRGIARTLGEDRDTTLFGVKEHFPLFRTWISGRIMIDPRTFIEARPAHDDDDLEEDRIRIPLTNLEEGSIPENMLLICYNWVRGYTFNERKWAYFRVDKIEEIDFADAFHSDLMLPQGQKDMILSLVQSNNTDEACGVDDFIHGKGKGVTLLLHGVPGVGKTLTAESVADHCRRPLLRLDAGIMSGDISEVEKAVSGALKLAERWKAIALIDEADVFLQQRSLTDLTRNGLVSVFLRALEYYGGILILTTNRVSVFDQAFKSRIHLAIQYPELEYGSRRSIWQTFLGKLSLHDDAAAELPALLDEMASKVLNGRQIRNAVQMAHALSLREDNTASMGIRSTQIRDALAAITAFDLDFGNGADDSPRYEAENGSKRRRIG
ncbi:hypothetical protein ACHAQA_005542 [Verticillium albo-atrum]